MTPSTPTPNGFYGLGIAPKLLDAIDKMKITTPTPIQAKAIPVAIEGQDVMGIAQTGTGKTFAFGIPMIQRLAQVKGRGLVILPTRELALQVDESFHKVGKSLGLRTAVLIGGVDMRKQLRMMHNKPHVIIGTPGRIIDHLDQKTLKLDDISILVLDEADRMFDMGFAPQIQRILKSVPEQRQTMLFSATMPEDITRLAAKYMKLPVRVEIARAGTAAEKVAQELFVVQKQQKSRLLEKLLSDYKGTILVFSRTKHGAKKICRDVKAMGHTSAELHSNRSLNQRKEALNGFKTGKYRVLVATDIAARGIDVHGIELVLNYDIPENAEDYVHRIGRTGRAGMTGKAVSFATPDQGSEIRQIERLVRVHLPVSKLPADLPAARQSTFEPRESRSFARREGGFARRDRGQRSGGGNRHGGQSRRPWQDRNKRPGFGNKRQPQGDMRRGFKREDTDDGMERDFFPAKRKRRVIF